MTNDNPKCPVCLTVQTGAHTCKKPSVDMDKEKEVKIYDLIENAPIEIYPTHVVDLKDYEAERTKREEAEKELVKWREDYPCCSSSPDCYNNKTQVFVDKILGKDGDPDKREYLFVVIESLETDANCYKHYLHEAKDKIKELEAKVKELEERNKELESQQGETMMLGGANIALNKRIDDLESQLAQAKLYEGQIENLIKTTNRLAEKVEYYQKFPDAFHRYTTPAYDSALKAYKEALENLVEFRKGLK